MKLEEEAKRQSVSWTDTIARLRSDPFDAAQAWAPVVLFPLAGMAVLQLYANYLRRIPGSAYVRPNFFRNRSIYGRVTSVGDGDNFHLFHTPGGRSLGWGWLRRIPETRKDLKDRTVCESSQIAHAPILTRLNQRSRFALLASTLRNALTSGSQHNVIQLKHSHG
jgi:hypothetical protein